MVIGWKDKLNSVIEVVLEKIIALEAKVKI